MASRYDVNAFDGILAAPQATGLGSSSLRAYREQRDAGAISRGTMGKLKAIAPEVEKHNASIGSAKQAAAKYKGAAGSWNSNADALQSLYDRYNADPGNRGLLGSTGTYQHNMNDQEFNMEVANRMITGGGAVNRPDKLSGEVYGPAYEVPDGSGGMVSKSDVVGYNKYYTDPERKALTIDGSSLKGKSDAAAASYKHDVKRYSPQQNLAQTETEAPSDSAFAETGNPAISSLAKYRSVKG